jgi:hypothetical protein
MGRLAEKPHADELIMLIVIFEHLDRFGNLYSIRDVPWNGAINDEFESPRPHGIDVNIDDLKSKLPKFSQDRPQRRSKSCFVASQELPKCFGSCCHTSAILLCP